jgi:hypothetical protein
MDAITTRNVGDIPADQRSALEHLLGGPLADNQQVFVGAFVPGAADPAARAAARDRLQSAFAARASNEGVTAQEADDAVDEAMRHIRSRDQ